MRIRSRQANEKLGLKLGFDTSRQSWPNAAMQNALFRRTRLVALCVCLWWSLGLEAGTFRVVSYNVENYLDAPAGTRRVKSDESRAKVREKIIALRPDVLALQEMGQYSALMELQASLKADGLDLPHAEWVTGWDTNIFVAVLSRFPFSERRSRTNESFLLGGRRLHASRGFAEVDIKVSPDYSFTLFTAHFKSKRPVAVADEAEMRLEEAKLLRRYVDQLLQKNPQANVVVTGDLNDFFNSPPVRTVVGRGNNALVDTRPAEKIGDDLPHPSNPAWFPRSVTWTHHWGAQDTYSRIDYILISPGMAREWDESGTYILTLPNWGQASDHRPIMATFHIGDR